MAVESSTPLIVENIDEQKKPPALEQQRIKSLSDQPKRYRDLTKQIKASETLRKAQNKLAQTRGPLHSVCAIYAFISNEEEILPIPSRTRIHFHCRALHFSQHLG